MSPITSGPASVIGGRCGVVRWSVGCSGWPNNGAYRRTEATRHPNLILLCSSIIPKRVWQLVRNRIPLNCHYLRVCKQHCKFQSFQITVRTLIWVSENKEWGRERGKIRMLYPPRLLNLKLCGTNLCQFVPTPKISRILVETSSSIISKIW